MCDEAKRRYRERNREKIRELGRERYRKNRDYYKKSSESYKQRFPVKRNAHVVVGNAIRDKKLFKEPCEICGDKNVQAHHDDYLKPLNVRWLCPVHHKQWHKENGEALNGVTNKACKG